MMGKINFINDIPAGWGEDINFNLADVDSFIISLENHFPEKILKLLEFSFSKEDLLRYIYKGGYNIITFDVAKFEKFLVAKPKIGDLVYDNETKVSKVFTSNGWTSIINQ